jgi:hypothetical protein
MQARGRTGAWGLGLGTGSADELVDRMRLIGDAYLTSQTDSNDSDSGTDGAKKVPDGAKKVPDGAKKSGVLCGCALVHMDPGGTRNWRTLAGLILRAGREPLRAVKFLLYVLERMQADCSANFSMLVAGGSSDDVEKEKSSCLALLSEAYLRAGDAQSAYTYAGKSGKQIQLARCLVAMKRYADAASVLKAALSAGNEDEGRVLEWLATVYVQTGNVAAAAMCLDRACGVAESVGDGEMLVCMYVWVGGW